MASELLKTKALSARIKEPKVRDFDFGLNLMSVESLIPDLPEPKPQELLDLQEQNRKQRLLQSLQKIGGRLEDSSLDFINRENFSEGKFGQNQFTKISGNSLKDLDYLEILNERIWQKKPDGSLLYEDKAFRDLAAPNGNVITNREMRALQEAGYTAPRTGRKVNAKEAAKKAKLRRDIDPNYLKDKAKQIVGRDKKGKVKSVIQHPYPKRLGETAEKLMSDKEGRTLFSEAESTLQNLDIEKEKLLKEPLKNKRRIEEIQAIQKILIKGKNVPTVTSTSPRTNKPVTKTNLKLTPKQKGFYGYENVDIDEKGNLTKKLKGADLSQTMAGLSDDPLNKVDFRNASPEDQKKLVEQMASKIKSDGPTLGMNAIAPAKAAELVDFSQLPKDFKNVSDEMIKPLVDKGKIFGKKSAKQILSMARPAAKLSGLEAILAAPFAVFDIGEGRPMKDVALNVATLGMGIPVKDAKRVSAFADKYGLKEDLFTAKMKLAGANKTRGYQEIELTADEEKALQAETYYKENILQPELDELKTIRQSNSDPNFGLNAFDMAEGGRIGYSGGSEGTDLAIKESLEAFQRYINAGGKLGYKDFIALGNEGVSKFFNKGGRVSFGSGAGPAPVRIIYFIMDRLRNLKNSTFSNYNEVRMYGEQKGIKELLEPYKNIPNKNRITSAIDDAKELKKFMPDEYKPILNEIIDDTKQFKFKTAHDKQQALEKALPKELKFENLPEEMFPMPNPENPNFIMPYGYPDKNPFQKSRITMRTEADKFTGKGTRKTYDTFNEETKQYQEPSKNTLISEEPIDEELESIIRDIDKGDLQ